MYIEDTSMFLKTQIIILSKVLSADHNQTK